jgi:lipoate---protein ligase
MTFHILEFNNKKIYEQLLLEEALLRTDDRNWCLINIGSPDAVVMGISSAIDKFINQDIIPQNIPVIKRYSGGGTVYVDSNTIFVTFIINKKTISNHLFPEVIHKWAENIYKDVFTFEGFALKENDYVIFNNKFGGNAQYIRKDRCVHHTTFLWDYKKENMNCLLLPPKMPQYRKIRNHSEFLTKIKHHFSDKKSFIKSLIGRLEKSFSIKKMSIQDINITKDHRRSTIRVI